MVEFNIQKFVLQSSTFINSLRQSAVSLTTSDKYQKWPIPTSWVTKMIGLSGLTVLGHVSTGVLALAIWDEFAAKLVLSGMLARNGPKKDGNYFFLKPRLAVDMRCSRG